ncbi:Fusaridione A cluster transcription factor fsdR [Colletotrichum sidae]|uniref:Fusaridione A cluster transcription factor fsdR n=1 Tax=Colletotrichum sidae TaxID=1347389 RepID=A0A4R8TMP2_9PEZI|nr:Fusaridione A cluster transcription factor fsdR [Colletotrichum sidae]
MYIQALEERLSKMEAVLSQAGIPRPDAPPTRVSPSETDAASVSVAPGPLLFPGTTGAPSQASTARIDALQTTFNQMSTEHPVADVQGPRREPRASDSPHEPGTQQQSTSPVPNFIPDPPEKLLGKMPVFGIIANRMKEVNSASYSSTFNRQVFTPRLDRREAINLLLPLYDDVVSNYPLLNFHHFSRLFETVPNAEETFNSTSGWAYMNLVIAVGTRCKTINSSFQDVCQLAWPFFKNGFSVLTELSVRGDDLLSVQATIAMAVYMQGTTCTKTSALLAAAATRLAQSVGLHRQPPNTIMSMCAADVEARSRVFWAAYILDKEMGLNHGLDSIQDDDDIETELPTGPTAETADVLNLRAKLAMVESSIRRRLYTAKGLRLADDDVVKAIIDLDALLEEWKSSCPSPELQPTYEPAKPGVELAPDVLDMHLAFYRCALMVHWTARRHGLYKSVAVLAGTPAGFELPYIQLSFSQKRCRAAAHAILGLFRVISTPQYADLWRMLCYPLCASTTLLADVLENPASPRARSDLAATRSFAHFLQRFEKSEGCDLKRVLTACAMMQRTAQYAVDDAQNTMRAQNLVGGGGGGGGGGCAAAGSGLTLIPPGFALSDDAQALHSLLGAATHPMYLIQGLMGNLPNRDQGLTVRLAHLLGTPFEGGKPGSPLGSQALQPETYGFGFGQGQAGNDPTANWY